jgi:hypothetical protein
MTAITFGYPSIATCRPASTVHQPMVGASLTVLVLGKPLLQACRVLSILACKILEEQGCTFKLIFPQQTASDTPTEDLLIPAPPLCDSTFDGRPESLGAPSPLLLPLNKVVCILIIGERPMSPHRRSSDNAHVLLPNFMRLSLRGSPNRDENDSCQEKSSRDKRP